MRFDQSQVLDPLVLLPAATYSADNTPAEVAIGQYQSATILLEIGVGGITFSGTNKIEFVLTHADTSGGAYTAVAATDVVMPSGYSWATGGIIRSLTAAHASATVFDVGYVGGKGFLKLLADFSGTHGTGTPLAACVLRGRPLRV